MRKERVHAMRDRDAKQSPYREIYNVKQIHSTQRRCVTVALLALWIRF